MATDVDRVRRPRADDDARRRLPRAVPERLRHRSAQGAHDGDHRRTRGLAARGVLRSRRLPRSARVGHAVSTVQRSDPHRDARHRDPRSRVRRGRRHHVGLQRSGRVRRDGRQGTRTHGEAPVVRAIRDPVATIRQRASATSTGTSRAFGRRAAYFGFAFDELGGHGMPCSRLRVASPTAPHGCVSHSTARAGSTPA